MIDPNFCAAPGANPFLMAANMLSNAFNGGMNRGSPGMGMGPMGPTNMAASPQPPGNWRDMMNKNAAQQRMYQNQMGPQMRGGAGPYNKPMRGNMKVGVWVILWLSPRSRLVVLPRFRVLNLMRLGFSMVFVEHGMVDGIAN